MFNISRLELARKRRRYSAKILAERAGISPVTLSRVTNGSQVADPATEDALIQALGFPREFFFRDEVDTVDSTAASFRSLTLMTARERDAALAAGSLAFEMADWVQDRFNLPEPDILDLSHERDPAAAARALRQYWSIGERPIGHMIKLLETKGVRVFSLAEDTKNVDAFSCWRNGEPYIFLNTFKTAERSRFDAAHELGHLVLHRHGGPQQGRQAEMEAQLFASSFLMPKDDLVAHVPVVYNLDQLVKAKKRWGVSVSALAYRLHKLGRISDWNYRTFVIQINREYGRNAEPDGLPPERSSIWNMVLTELWKDKVTRDHIAADLNLPPDEVENLIFGLAGEIQPPSRAQGKPTLVSVT
jgi:Zn-dependent peptidase ImmA (M78 family)